MLGKKKRRLNGRIRRRIRKTTAVVLLITSIVVAAIPVPGAAAADGDWTRDNRDPKVTSVTTKKGVAGGGIIPVIEPDAHIYTDMGTGIKFAIDTKTDPNEPAAVLLQCDTKDLKSTTIDIKENVGAFRPYGGTGSDQQVAVNEKNLPLFYKAVSIEVYKIKKENGSYVGTWSKDTSLSSTVPETETTNNQTKFTPLALYEDKGYEYLQYVTYKFQPCLNDTDAKAKWKVDGVNYYIYKKNDNQSGEYEYVDLYDPTARGKYDFISRLLIDHKQWEDNFGKANDTGNGGGWLNPVVRYISNQRVVSVSSVSSGNAETRVVTPEEGKETSFFGTSTPPDTIILPRTLKAIADKAFYNCVSLTGVEFSKESGQKQLQLIGASAFAGCSGLANFSFPEAGSSEFILGQSAFEGCKVLEEIILPPYIQMIGDRAFRGCELLKTVGYDPNRKDRNLKAIGNAVFENCTSLEDITLPNSLEKTGVALFAGCVNLKNVVLPANAKFNDLYFADFEGCVNLRSIDALDPGTTFQTDPSYAFDVEDFKAQLKDKAKFYFCGEDDSSKIHDITYNNGITFKFHEDAKGFEVADGEAIYRIDANNVLTKVEYKKKVPFDAEIPAAVGGKPIQAFGDGVFKNNKLLRSIYIPNTIHKIEAETFMGCNILEKVTFEDPAQGDADRKGIVSIGKNAFRTQEGAKGDPNKLLFVGMIDDKYPPYQYAVLEKQPYSKMDGTQTVSYIEYSSGTASVGPNKEKIINVHVKYKKDTDQIVVTQVPDAENVMNKNHNVAGDEYAETLKNALREQYKNDVSGNTVSGNYDIDQRIKDSMDDMVDAYKLTGTLPTGVYSENAEAAFWSAMRITLPPGAKEIASGLFSNAKDNQEKTVRKTTSKDGSVVEENAEALDSSIKRNQYVKEITMYDVEGLDDYAFYGCKALETVVMYPSGKGSERIGSYAFGQCENLKRVTLPATTAIIGFDSNNANLKAEAKIARPFAGAKKLISVSFAQGRTGARAAGTGKFFYENGIVYELATDGKSKKIVECLIQRGDEIGENTISADEMEDVIEIYPEAFMDCDNIAMVDFTNSSKLTEIPDYAFANASRLAILSLPALPAGKSFGNLGQYALKDTGLIMLNAPNGSMPLDEKTFYKTDAPNNLLRGVNVITPEGSSVESRVKSSTFKDAKWKTNQQPKYTIRFMDDDGTTLIAEKKIDEGDPVISPDSELETDATIKANWAKALEKHKGMYFVRWSTDFTPATKDKTVKAVFAATPPKTWKVDFLNDDLKSLLKDGPRIVQDGAAVEEPKTPTSYKGADWKFVKWLSRPKDTNIKDIPLNKITGDVEFIASYDPPSPTSSPAPNNNNNGGGNNNNGTPTPAPSSQTYTLTVVNGSGSGSYPADTSVSIAANTPNTGYEFDSWTSSESDTEFTSKTLSATAIKMPAKNLTVTANYREVSGEGVDTKRGTVTSDPESNTGSTIAGTNTAGNNGGNNVNGGNGGGDGSTDVQLNRPGMSDGDVASATVNGSTDNFIVKVTEDGQATAAVAEALRNEYGSLENIHYFAMDISLYDSTGTYKITDTSGISVTMTLPIPDELRQYAGNNKVGAVIGGNNLEKLNARFTTVNDVPCVSFTATHFSPYTIYVDTANLLSGGYDATPKTGDAIHPKWFLAAGLALFSAVLFLKRDKKVYRAA